MYLCDYGYHSSLLLPVGGGVYVEYLFGDYRWAALNQTGAWPAVRSQLFCRQATLGRRYVTAAGPPAAVRPMSPPVAETTVIVDGDGCRRLQQALDRRWMKHADTAVYAGATGGYYLYVKDDEPYSLLHNCNRETAGWLDALGCRTGGLPILSHFTVDAPK